MPRWKLQQINHQPKRKPPMPSVSTRLLSGTNTMGTGMAGEPRFVMWLCCELEKRCGGRTISSVPWEVNKDTFLAVPIRRIAADTVRVEIVRWHQEGGGLSEVEVFSGKENIARGCRVMVSAEYDARFSGAKLTDGITTSSTGGVGYWLLPNGHSGWAEIHSWER